MAKVSKDNAKTPIRQMRHIAKDVADAAKEAGLRNTNSVTFEIFESLSPPDDSINSLRKHLFGIAPDEDADYFQNTLAKQLALPGDKFAVFRDRLISLASESGSNHLPRSQLYKALRAARVADVSLFSPAASDSALLELKTYAKRMGKPADEMRSRVMLPLCEGVRSRDLSVELAMLAQFWDYADPLPDPIELLSGKVGG